MTARAPFRRSLSLRVATALTAVMVVVGGAPGPAAARSPGPGRTLSPVPSPSVIDIDRETAVSPWFSILDHDEGGSDLYVGRLDARTHRVLSLPTRIRATGPHDRVTYAWWRDGGQTVVVGVRDTGSWSEFARLPGAISAASASPDGRRWTWVAARPDGTASGVWLRRIWAGPGRDERLLGAIDEPIGRMVWSDDGRRLALESETPAGVRIRVVDVETGTVDTIADDGHGSVAGFLGTDLVLSRAPAAYLELPLSRVDPVSGVVVPFIEGEGSGAAVVDGRLVWEGAVPDGRQAIFVLDPGAETPRTLWIGDGPMADASAHLAPSTDRLGVEIDGWLALIDGWSHLTCNALGLACGGPVTLVGLTGGAVAVVNPRPVEPPVGLAWEPVTLGGPAGDRWVADVVADDGGFLAIGAIGERRRWMTWRSTDGRRWRATPFPLPTDVDASPRLVTRGSQVVVAASIEDDGGGRRLAVWTSDDGRRWTRVPAGDAPRAPSDPRLGDAHVSGIGLIHDRFVVITTSCIESCRAWSVWSSADGRTWDRVRVPSGPRGRVIEDLFVGRDRLIASARVFRDGRLVRQAVVASGDGRRWRPIGAWPAGGDRYFEARETADGFVAFGADADAGGLRIWRSPDARAWTEVHREDVRWGIDGWVVDGDRSVFLGRVLVDVEADDDEPAALVSSDGVSWARSQGWIRPPIIDLAQLAISGDVVVAMGSAPHGTGRSAWRAVLPEPQRRRSEAGRPVALRVVEAPYL